MITMSRAFNMSAQVLGLGYSIYNYHCNNNYLIE